MERDVYICTYHFKQPSIFGDGATIEKDSNSPLEGDIVPHDYNKFWLFPDLKRLSELSATFDKGGAYDPRQEGFIRNRWQIERTKTKNSLEKQLEVFRIIHAHPDDHVSNDELFTQEGNEEIRQAIGL